MIPADTDREQDQFLHGHLAHTFLVQMMVVDVVDVDDVVVADGEVVLAKADAAVVVHPVV